jgi:hypothetical protein
MDGGEDRRPDFTVLMALGVGAALRRNEMEEQEWQQK